MTAPNTTRRLLALILLLAPAAALTPDAIAPLAQLASASSAGFVDLALLGGPAGYAMSSSLLSLLQQVLINVFSTDASSLASTLTGGSNNLAGLAAGAAGGFAAGLTTSLVVSSAKSPGPLPPPLLPPLPKGHPLLPFASAHDVFLQALASKWAAALVKVQYNPGLQGFLRLLGLDQLQEALLKWVCILTPWADALLPKLLRELRGAYCINALPAAAASKILAGPAGGGPLPLGKPLPLPLAGPGSAFGR